MKKKRLFIAVIVIIFLGVFILILSWPSPQINTNNALPVSGEIKSTPLSTSLKPQNAVSEKVVWQIVGSKLIGFDKTTGNETLSFNVPTDFHNGTAIESYGNSVLITNQQGEKKFAVINTNKNKSYLIKNGVSAVTIVGENTVIYWENTAGDVAALFSENLVNQNKEQLTTFAKTEHISLQRVNEDSIIIIPDYATDLSNSDLIIFNIKNKRVEKEFPELGYMFAISEDAKSVYTTTYNFSNQQIESYYLNVVSGQKQKLPRILQAEPNSKVGNAVYVSAIADTGYDLVSLIDGKVRVISQSPVGFVDSIVNVSAKQLLVKVSGENESQLITVK